MTVHDSRDADAADAAMSRRGAHEAALADLFRVGVAEMDGDDRLRALCDAATGDDSPWRPRRHDLLELASNHRPREVTRGDMLRFVGDSMNHIGTKVLIRRDRDGFTAEPSRLRRGGEWWAPPRETLELAWDLVDEIVTKAPHVVRGGHRLAVKLERIEYPRSSEELAAIRGLLLDVGGPLSRLGHRLDAARAAPRGRLRGRFGRELYALAHLGRWSSRVVRRLDGAEDLPPGHRLLASDHLDNGKVFSLIAGERGALRTEVAVGGRWRPLSVGRDRAAVFGGGDGALLGVPPMRHRVLLSESGPADSDSNVTLILAAVRDSGRP